MATGDIVQDTTPVASSGNVASFASPALSTPTPNNTDFILAISSATITTPSGYSRDIFDVSNSGIYIFRRTVQAGDTGAAVTLTVGSRPISIFRYEVSGTAALDGTPSAIYHPTGSTFTRTANPVTTANTDGVFVFGTDISASVQTWSAWNLGIVQVDTAVPTGGTQPDNGMVAYGNNIAAGTLTPSATSTLNSTKYQMLVAAYTYTPAAPPAATPNAIQGLPLTATVQASSW